MEDSRERLPKGCIPFRDATWWCCQNRPPSPCQEEVQLCSVDGTLLLHDGEAEQRGKDGFVLFEETAGDVAEDLCFCYFLFLVFVVSIDNHPSKGSVHKLARRLTNFKGIDAVFCIKKRKTQWQVKHTPPL